MADLSKMNFLAHFLLAFDDDDLLVGQFSGDHVKGTDLSHLPERIEHGIRLHRFIDNFTDTHPINSDLRKLIRPYCGLWSPVAIDLLYDHYLARHWKTYHPSDLQDFAQKCYKILEENHDRLPEQANQTLMYMKRYDWLSSYYTEQGISRAFEGLSKRLQNGESLVRGLEALEHHGNNIEDAFNTFIPQLIDATKDKLSTFATVKKKGID